MNKEQLLQLMSGAIDQRGSVTVHLSQFEQGFTPISKDEAEQRINAFAQALGVTEIENNVNHDVAHDFTIRTVVGGVDFYIVSAYVPHLIDDLNCEEGVSESA